MKKPTKPTKKQKETGKLKKKRRKTSALVNGPAHVDPALSKTMHGPDPSYSFVQESGI
jgi:hypothetical protein